MVLSIFRAVPALGFFNVKRAGDCEQDGKLFDFGGGEGSVILHTPQNKRRFKPFYSGSGDTTSFSFLLGATLTGEPISSRI